MGKEKLNKRKLWEVLSAPTEKGCFNCKHNPIDNPGYIQRQQRGCFTNLSQKYIGIKPCKWYNQHRKIKGTSKIFWIYQKNET